MTLADVFFVKAPNQLMWTSLLQMSQGCFLVSDDCTYKQLVPNVLTWGWNSSWY